MLWQDAKRPDLDKLMPLLLPHEQIDWQQGLTSWIKRLEAFVTDPCEHPQEWLAAHVSLKKEIEDAKQAD
jgi:hypothetical protein